MRSRASTGSTREIVTIPIAAVSVARLNPCHHRQVADKSPADERQVQAKSGELISIGPLDDTETSDLFSLFRHVVATGEGFPHSPPLTRQDFESTWVTPVSVVVAARLDGRLVGAYYLKPNFVGKAAHIANAGYMVASVARRRGAAARSSRIPCGGPRSRVSTRSSSISCSHRTRRDRYTRSSGGVRQGASRMPLTARTR